MLPAKAVDREFVYIVGRADGRSVSPKLPKAPESSPKLPKAIFFLPQTLPNAPQSLPKALQSLTKPPQSSPKSPQSCPKPSSSFPKLSPELPKASPKLPKASPKPPQISSGYPKPPQKPPDRKSEIDHHFYEVKPTIDLQKCCKVCKFENGSAKSCVFFEGDLQKCNTYATLFLTLHSLWAHRHFFFA